MKTTILKPVEVNIHSILIEAAVNYEEEEIPNDFPLRNGEMWRAQIEIDTGKIIGWPHGRAERMHLTVKDEGSYTLLDDSNRTITRIENSYVPHGVVPGKYGDVILLTIDANGIVTNWPKNPKFDDFGED